MSELDDLLEMVVEKTCFYQDWNFSFMGVPDYCNKHKVELERFTDAREEIFFSCPFGLQLWNNSGLEYETY